jgi:antitoxin VapB
MALLTFAAELAVSPRGTRQAGLKGLRRQALTGGAHLADAETYAREVVVRHERRVKLFKNGRNQAVRIPREFELPGQDAILRKEGERLVIEPVPPKSLLALLAMLAPLEEEFLPAPDSAPDPVEL